MTTTPGSQRTLRVTNQRRVTSAVRAAGSLTQAEIARATGLAPATVSSIVRDLVAAGTVRTRGTVSGGRRATAVSLSRSAGLAVGIDFGRTHLRVAVADLAHQVVAEQAVPLRAGEPARSVIRDAAGLVDALLAQVGADRSAVVGVGAGVPGPVDRRSLRVVDGTITPEWMGVQPQQALGDELGLPVQVDNDANLGVLAESIWGVAKGVRNVAYVKVATGVGAGLVIDGNLFRGETGTAGEIGHTTIDENGAVCRCGNRGCLETMASGPAICDLLEPSLGYRPTTQQVIALAGAGDAGCRRVLEDAGRYVGVAVANLCNLVNPAVVVIGGELAPAHELILEPMRGVVRRRAVPAASAVTVTTSALGERAQALGALALVLRDDATR